MTTPRAIVGIDPGQDSAALVALLDDGSPLLQVAAVGSYRRSQRRGIRGWRVSTWPSADEVDPADGWTHSASDAVHRLVGVLGYVETVAPVVAVTVEGARWGGGKGRRRTAASIAALATSRGRILQALHEAGHPASFEPVAAEWRPRVLRVSGASSGEAAKHAAIAWVTGRRVLRRDVPDWRVAWPEVLTCQDHEAEAACLAVWGRPS
tara:strand:- start:230 stop:853 length:624 start_codon:yes stop_codon:yes gene_type:complete